MAKRKTPALPAGQIAEGEHPSASIGPRSPLGSEVLLAKPRPREVWSRNGAPAAGSGIARVWEEFLDGKQACFWGLTFDEGLLARRLASKRSLGADLSPEMVPDDDLMPIIYVILSARGGDTEEFAYNPALKAAPLLLDPTKEADREYVKTGMGGGRLRLLAQQVEQLSVLSMPRIAEYVSFFQLVTGCLFGCTNSLLPSIREALATSFDEEAIPMRNYRRMERELTELLVLGRTLLPG